MKKFGTAFVSVADLHVTSFALLLACSMAVHGVQLGVQESVLLSQETVPKEPGAHSH